MNNEIQEKLRQLANIKYQRLKKRSEILKIQPPTKEDIENILFESYDNGFKCYYCNKTLDIDCPKPYKDSPSIDHKKPLNDGGTNNRDNMILCCHACNLIKGTKTADTYIAMIGALRNVPGLCESYFNESFNGRLAIMIEQHINEKLGCAYISSYDPWITCGISLVTMTCRCHCFVDRGCPGYIRKGTD